MTEFIIFLKINFLFGSFDFASNLFSMYLKPFFFIISFIFFPFFLFSQNIRTYSNVEGGFSSIKRELCGQFISQRGYIHENNFSWGIGVNLEYQILKNTFIDSGLRFSLLGGKDSETRTINTILTEGRIINKSKFKLYYISIPFFLKYKIKKIGFRIGYQISYSVNAVQEVNDGVVEGIIPGNPIIETFKGDVDPKPNLFDSGLVFGCSYEILNNIAISVIHYSGSRHIRFDRDRLSYCRENRRTTLGINLYF